MDNKMGVYVGGNINETLGFVVFLHNDRKVEPVPL